MGLLSDTEGMSMLSGVTQGLKAGLLSYRDAQRQKLEREKLQQALEARKAMQATDAIKTAGLLTEKGMEPEYDQSGGLIGFKKGPLFDEIQRTKTMLTRAQYENLMSQAEERQRLIDVKEEKGEADIDYTRARAEAARAGAAKTRRSGAPVSKTVPGLQHDGKTPVDQTEARKVKEGYGAARTLENQLNRLEAKLRGMGRLDLLDPNKMAEVNQLLRAAQIQYKGPSFAQLGVIAGPDEKIMTEAIGSPKSLAGIYGGPSKIADLVKTFKEQTLQDFSARVGVYGYTPQFGAVGTKPSGTAKQGVPKQKPSTIRQNGVIYTLDPATGEYK